jgi:signal transduction histidine kinase
VLSRLSLTWVDVLVPALVLGLGAIELAALDPPNWGYGLAVEAGACLVLVWRRRHPIVTGSLAAIANNALPFIGPAMDEVAVPIFIAVLITYSLARWVSGYWGLVGVGVLLLGLLSGYLFVDERSHDVTDLFFVASLLTPPYIFGRVTRRLATTTELLRQQQELVKREAVRDERDRIARELHDVIAHSISAMVVQTAAAQDLVRSDPDRAEEALANVASTGRRALSETGRLLHVIRDADDELGLSPAPGLADLPELVETFRRQGLQVDLDVDGDLAGMPAGVDVSAYRIVQEALTNAARYAADRAVGLPVACAPGQLRIGTSNLAGGSTGLGSGLGLVGLAERVHLLGGTLRHGPSAYGRFDLEVSIPLPEGQA